MLKDKDDLNILKIFLDYNKLSGEGAKRIVKQLANMKNLKQIEMHIRNNKIAEKTKKEIKNDFKLKIQASYKEVLVWVFVEIYYYIFFLSESIF